ncbi:hypothetical protein HK098_004087 [Nowakowskiella sp. JEL0407]|nr:hypothetical protein HK098_004087 [Nowakowskiella sp. JEL0407]
MCKELYYCGQTLAGESCFKSDIGGNANDPNSLPQLNVVRVQDSNVGGVPIGTIIGLFLAGAVILAGFIITITFFRKKNLMKKTTGYAPTNSSSFGSMARLEIPSTDRPEHRAVYHEQVIRDRPPFQPQSDYSSEYNEPPQHVLVPIQPPVLTSIPVTTFGENQYVYYQSTSNGNQNDMLSGPSSVYSDQGQPQPLAIYRYTPVSDQARY